MLETICGPGYHCDTFVREPVRTVESTSGPLQGLYPALLSAFVVRFMSVLVSSFLGSNFFIWAVYSQCVEALRGHLLIRDATVC